MNCAASKNRAKNKILYSSQCSHNKTPPYLKLYGPNITTNYIGEWRYSCPITGMPYWNYDSLYFKDNYFDSLQRFYLIFMSNAILKLWFLLLQRSYFITQIYSQCFHPKQVFQDWDDGTRYLSLNNSPTHICPTNKGRTRWPFPQQYCSEDKVDTKAFH